ncbi:MAG: hypothetical protein JO032_00935 [Alphaproteobacteria bacterium]|nr:hypothetical protein [Alphaproteobacteria bacterium]MBV9551331.1 hypothetical protein [Alphaproteobacteria bacterium]
MPRTTAAALVAIALLWPASVLAMTGNGRQMLNKWATSSRCAQQAQKAFPDFTAEANAKRDALLKQCLAGGNLPPRPSLDAEVR